MVSKVDFNVNGTGFSKINIEKFATEMPNSVFTVKASSQSGELAPLITPQGQNLSHSELVKVANDLIAKADKSDPDWKNKLIQKVGSLNYCMTTIINIQNQIRMYNG